MSKGEPTAEVRFSPDSSGILLTTMAMLAVAEGGVEVTATHTDTIARTPLARQIQADGRIGFKNSKQKKWAN